MKLPELEHRHTPSNRLHRWLDFFLHGRKLYDKKTGIGTCAICGKSIRYPQQYAVTLIANAFPYSSLSLIMALLLRQYLKNVAKLNYWLVLGASVLLGVTLFLLSRRIYTSFALSNGDWIEIPEGKNAKQEAINQYKQDRLLVIQAECKGLILGQLLIFIVKKLF